MAQPKGLRAWIRRTRQLWRGHIWTTPRDRLVTRCDRTMHADGTCPACDALAAVAELERLHNAGAIEDPAAVAKRLWLAVES